MDLPTNIKQWLNKRGITDRILEINNISWNGGAIVIPIYNEDGKFLFNKYRKDPFSNDNRPKYWYDTGTTATLYNIDKIPFNVAKEIIICEGELDVLALKSEGYYAVSSTGGSGTFKEEWVKFFGNNEVYVCYDNDEAGMKGAVNVLTKVPHSRWIVLPESVGKGGDITDFLVSGGDFEKLIDSSSFFSIFSEKEPDEIDTIKLAKEWIRTYKLYTNELMEKRRVRINGQKSVKQIDYIIPALVNRIDNLKRVERKIRYNKKKKDDIFDHPIDNPDKITARHVEEAKLVPITNFYHEKLRTSGGRSVGKCPFHEENTASFTIYLDTNTFYCYGCSAGRDVIDYVMKERNVDFQASVKIILNL